MCEPTPESLAAAIDGLWTSDRAVPVPDGIADQIWQRAAGAMVEGLRAIAPEGAGVRA